MNNLKYVPMYYKFKLRCKTHGHRFVESITCYLCERTHVFKQNLRLRHRH